MTKSILFSFILLCCTAWVAAQSTTPSSPSSGSSGSSAGSQSGTGQTGSQTTGQSGSENGQTSGAAGSSGQMNGGSNTTLRGCLSSSGGGYALTDASGTQYQLSGDTSKLSDHVNQEVEVKGSSSGSGASASTGSSAGSQAATGSAGAGTSGQMFSVTKVKKVSGTCSSGTNSTGGTNR
jgi:Protein of unknown function (DUF5818)